MRRSCPCSQGRAAKTNCMDQTLEMINSFQIRYNCILENEFSDIVGMSIEYIGNQLTLINEIIIDKINSAASCTYKNQIIVMQEDMQKISQFTDC